jgi:aminopeptidase N
VTRDVLLAPALALVGALAAAQPVDVWSRPERRAPQSVYDALHYRIALRLDDRTRSFTGRATITLAPLRDGLRTVTLDAETFRVTAATGERGERLRFTQGDGHLAIELPRPAPRGRSLTLTVAYESRGARVDPTKYGMSADYPLGLAFLDETKDNPALVETLTFPEGARHFFPCFDHPSDKASTETIVTVRPDWRVLANGRLEEVKDEPDGTRTFHWRQDQPLSTYLVVVAAGPYEVLKDRKGDLPLGYWVYPKDVADAPRSFRRTPEILRFFERTYGVPYPWPKYDQATIPGIRGGMESTSATMLGQSTIHDEKGETDFPSAWLVAHEAAHQWWGDLVTLADWSETWLNESFATYGEYLFSRYSLGDDEGAVNLLGKRIAYLREAREKYVRPIVFDRWQWPNDNFDRHTYEKGALVLHMLRDLLGDEAFFKAHRVFLEKHALANVTTRDLQAAFEAASGQDLAWFFDQWVRKPGHPVLEVTETWDEARHAVRLRVRQRQDTARGTPIFRARVRVGLRGDGWRRSETVWISRADEELTLGAPTRPRLVRFDEDDVLLKEITFRKPVEELRYQLVHDDVMGRVWAAGELGRVPDDSAASAALREAARADTFWKVREAAVDALGSARRGADAGLLEDAAQEGSSKVRAAALRALGALESPARAPFLAERFRADESYLAQAEALRALGRSRDPAFLDLVSAAAEGPSARDVLRIAALEARAALEKCRKEPTCAAR